MPIERKYQLDDDSRKEYIENRIIPYIPAIHKEGYIERIPAVVGMYAGLDAEVISIIEDAIGKDNGTNECFHLERVLGILVDNLAKKKAGALKECYKLLNINHSMPKRAYDAPISPPKSKRTGSKNPLSENIDQILAYCA
jgi:hypothetical protein